MSTSLLGVWYWPLGVCETMHGHDLVADKTTAVTAANVASLVNAFNGLLPYYTNVPIL